MNANETDPRGLLLRTQAPRGSRARIPLSLLWLGFPTLFLLSLALAAAVLPVQYEAGEAPFEIPRGTWAGRRAGKDLEILPAQIRLVAGMTLVLRNHDDVPQVFGPTLIMPGQSLRLPFDLPAEYQFMCTAHVSGQMTIVVEEAPTSPWARVRWRLRKLRTLV
jgi:hypothetical protein